MRYNYILPVLIMLMCGLNQKKAFAQVRVLDLDLRTRDAETNEVIIREEKVSSSKIGIIVVDPWNYHWCMTANERVSAMIPRFNKVLEVARRMKIPVIWCPSDVIGSYSGYPQRERVLGMELMDVPEKRAVPGVKFTAHVAGCMCGAGIVCKVNYGFDSMHPELFLDEDDYIASSTPEVYTLLINHGITHVIYMGLHTNMCLYSKPGALKYMWQAGFNCILARDCNDAFTNYDPAEEYTPDDGTKQIDEDIERAGISTINIAEEWKMAGLWNSEWLVEKVRVTPWGKIDRPFFFNDSVIVTLSNPWLKDAEIRYTLDGSPPDRKSFLYKEPFEIKSSIILCAAAFHGDRLISIPTGGYFVLLPPEPPKPGIYLDDLNYIIDPYGQSGSSYAACLWLPETGKSYENKVLRVRGINYEKGLGFRAPSSVRYELRPEYKRFVARAGVDDNLLDNELGRNLAMHSSVIFRVFIDGKMMDESPVMRISQEPWNFNVEIPRESRFINLVCMDAGSRHKCDLGNWINAGFCLE